MGLRLLRDRHLGFRSQSICGEIVEQLYWTMESVGQKPTNIVFMGMGEPLHNFEQVTRALSIMEHPWGAGLSPRRMTVSTSGVVTGIDLLAKVRPLPNLAISLNATTDEVRDRIMPVNRRWNIAALLAAARRFPLGHHAASPSNTCSLPGSTTATWMPRESPSCSATSQARST